MYSSIFLLLFLFKCPGSNIRKQIVLDGPVNCGKSIALAMLVQWARDEGWLVLYVPSGRRWTHGGFFFKNPQTGLWDTPVQAEDVLRVRTFSCYLRVRLKYWYAFFRIFWCICYEYAGPNFNSYLPQPLKSFGPLSHVFLFIFLTLKSCMCIRFRHVVY